VVSQQRGELNLDETLARKFVRYNLLLCWWK